MKTIKFIGNALVIGCSIAVAVLSLGFGILAWTDGGAPLGGNMVAPLNVGPAVQYKTGDLFIGGNMGAGTQNPQGRLDVRSGDICLNGKCCSDWTDCLGG